MGSIHSAPARRGDGGSVGLSVRSGALTQHHADGTPADAAFAELAELAVSAQPLVEILQRTVDLARSVIAAPGEVSVTLITGDDATTPVATDPLATTLDEVQYAHGYGPCLDSARVGHAVRIGEMGADDRWPEFAAAAREAGVCGSLSVPLPVQRHVIGALNVYLREPGALDDDRARLAEQFASYAGVAIGNTNLYLSSARLAAQMQEAMSSRAVIEQAKGILMAVYRCDAAAAFGRLTARSQHTHRKLRDVARDIVAQATQSNR